MFRTGRHWQRNDGGRAAAGYRGDAGDCVVRAIAIATNRPYQEVYDGINALRDSMRQTHRVKKSSARDGVSRVVYERYLKSLGWRFVATMKIGSGCKVHLRKRELPDGRIIVRVSKHMTAVIDGVIHDTHDCSRGGTRCVYGYFTRDSGGWLAKLMGGAD
jgi:hypothetical protein